MGTNGEKYPVPLSMSMMDRNDRLYETLLSLGLFVAPIFADENHNCIDHFIVSTGMPNLLQVYGQDQG